MDNPRYMRREVRPGKLEMDLETQTLIVNYEVEATVLDDFGEPLEVKQKAHQKRIKLRPLDEHANLVRLAEEILESCNLIPVDKLGEVVDLLAELQDACIRGTAQPKAERKQKKKAKVSEKQRIEDERKRQEAEARKREIESASMDKIEDYLEKLYDDDVAEKVKGAQQILHLARALPSNLEILVQHEGVMGALSRTLREEYKKRSMDLTTNLMCIFYCFSNFRQMHTFVAHHRIGDISLKILELEHKRHLMRMEEMSRLTYLAQAQQEHDTALEEFVRGPNTATAIKEWIAARKAKVDGTAADTSGGGDDVADTVTQSSGTGVQRPSSAMTQPTQDEDDDEDDDEGGASDGEKKKAKKKSKKSKKSKDKDKKERKAAAKLKPLPSGPVDLERERLKMKVIMDKQEKLAKICALVLLNLAEEVSTERKMSKRGIVNLLVPLLERPNPELLVTVCTFLRKLSMFEENKEQMKAADIITKLATYIPCQSELVLKAVLRLMFNLSFDEDIKQTILDAGLLPKLVQLLRFAPYREIVVKLLYHLSMLDEAKRDFASTPGVQVILGMVIKFPANHILPELIGLSLNLSLDDGCAAQMVKGQALSYIIARLKKTKDPLIMKLLRNLSDWTRREQDALDEDDEDEEWDHADLWGEHLGDVCDMLKTQDDMMIVEALGLLGNMTEMDIDEDDDSLATLLVEHDVLPSLARALSLRAEDDLNLVAIMALGAFAADEDAAPVIAASSCIPLLAEILVAKGDDPEIVTQCIFTAYQLAKHKPTMEQMIYGSTIVTKLTELLSARGDPYIISMLNELLDGIILHDKEYGQEGQWRQIQLQRFRLYNRQWWEVIQAEDEHKAGMGGGMGGIHAGWGDGAESEDSSDASAYGGDGGTYTGISQPMHMQHQNVAVDFSMLGGMGAQDPDLDSDGGYDDGPGRWETGAPAGGGDDGPYWHDDEPTQYAAGAYYT